MKFGHFDDANREYVITNPRTVLAPTRIRAIGDYSHRNIRYAVAESSHEHQSSHGGGIETEHVSIDDEEKRRDSAPRDVRACVAHCVAYLLPDGDSIALEFHESIIALFDYPFAHEVMVESWLWMG